MDESKERITENKVIILYVLKEIEIPVTNLQLIDILTNIIFMNYFTQQETLGELLKTELISEYIDETEHKFYKITEKGKAVTSTLSTLIPAFIKQNFDSNKSEIKEMVKKQWEINAVCSLDENDNHFVRCFVRDNDNFLIDIKVSAGNKKIATKMSSNWKRNTEKIYLSLITQLLDE